jgi:hypothetical protein
MSRLGIRFNVARIGSVLIGTALAVATVPSEAAAEHAKHVVHRRALSLDVQNARASLNESSRQGAMRYYGGPKSPMWREVP